VTTIYTRPAALEDVGMHYCPGCTHGIIHRLVAETLDELELTGRAIGIAPVGCAVFAYNYFKCDMIEASHGRAPAVATGLKRVLPDRIIFSYQGDGDLASIGLAEVVHAASRGENITVIFINNAVYGMTGGQMAPTTLLGQVTTTTPRGRDPALAGYPIRVCELLASQFGPAYLARVAITGPRTVRQAKRALRRAFEAQVAGLGFSLVEVLSTCPTRWGKAPLEAMEWVEKEMMKVFPLGEFSAPRLAEAAGEGECASS
jgi:2-oxoglutarate ferredoxin oxidoreductase subunit beta